MHQMLRRAGAILSAAAMLVVAAACGSSNNPAQGNSASAGGGSASGPASPGPASANPGTLTIGASEINLSLPFFVDMKTASDKIASAYGVDVTWQSADGSLNKQIATIQNFIAQKKDVIMIDPLNAKALVPVVNKATDAGIKVITMGNKVLGTANVSTLYPDHDNWVKNAEILGNALHGKGTVLFLVGSVGNYVSDTRQQAFDATMAKGFPGIKVITQPTNFDSSTAANVTQTVLTNNPDIAGLASISDGMTLPALKVLQQHNKLGIPVVTNDGDPNVYPYIGKGQVLSDVLTGDFRVGAWNTAVAARLAKGSTFPRDVFMPTYFIMTNKELASAAGVKAITPAQATPTNNNYLEEFAPSKSDGDMTVQQ